MHLIDHRTIVFEHELRLRRAARERQARTARREAENGRRAVRRKAA